jgi:hypothetical protein
VAPERDQWRSVMNTPMKLRILSNAERLIASQEGLSSLEFVR